MSAIEAYALAQARRIPGARLEWEEWQQLRDGPQLASLKYLIENPNPEVILSALDLFAAARVAHDQVGRGVWDAAKRAGDQAELDRLTVTLMKEQVKSQTSIGAPLRARAFVRQSLHEFFRYRHRLDAAQAERPSRTYLRELLETLVPGDVVITFNWDALAERVLGELGRWTPLDGYGMDKKHLSHLGQSLPGPRNSTIRVLKLHGSIGWYWNPHRGMGPDLLFDGYSFLKDLGFPSDSEPFGQSPENPISDPEALLDLYLGSPVMIYPTFLKSIASYEIAKLWYLADRAIRKADRIEIYGYSLPDSDGAARILLNCIRHRTWKKGCEPLVVDPSEAAGETWRSFLGARMRFEKRGLGRSS
jgi:hypothetical protein